MIIERLNDSIRRITTDYSLGKNRSGSDTVSASFRWDAEKNMHISCDMPTTLGKPRTTREREALVERMGGKGWAYSDLTTLIMKESGKSTRTAKRWITELLEIGLIEQKDGVYNAKINKTTERSWCNE